MVTDGVADAGGEGIVNLISLLSITTTIRMYE